MTIQKMIKKLMSVLLIAVLVVSNISTTTYATTPSSIYTATDIAVTYLSSLQSEDGKIPPYIGGESDWATIALNANGTNLDSFSKNGVSLKDYIVANPANSSTSAAAVELRMLAIHAMGYDTKDFNGINYDELLDGAHNNGQIGDPAYLNDEVFGILAVKAADNPLLQPLAQDALNVLLQNQKADGSFCADMECAWGVDTSSTASTYVALRAAKDLGLTGTNTAVEDGMAKALAYILEGQQSDGGFCYDSTCSWGADSGSTAWALIALNTVGSAVDTEVSAASNWLLARQNVADGGFGDYGSDPYTTSHTIIALLGTNWILNPVAVARPSIPQPVTITTPMTTQTPLIVAAKTAVTPLVSEPIDEPIEAVVLAAQDTLIPQVSKPSVVKQSAKTAAKSTHWTTSNFFGYGLITTAALGTAGYAVRRQRHTVKIKN